MDSAFLKRLNQTINIMKKLFMLIGLTLSLTGLVTAQTEWITPQPLKDYLYTTNSMATGEFFDLNTAYTSDNGTIAPNDAAKAYGVQDLMLFGENLATGTSLNNRFFSYNADNGAWEVVVRASGATATALRLEDFGITSFSFLEKRVTGLMLSAAGGIYFTDDESGEAVEMALPDPLADLETQSVQYAARGFIAKYTNGENAGQYTQTMTSVPITKMADRPVGCMALCTDGLTGLPYILVQYNLLVNSHTLVYQILIGDDGRVEYRIGTQDKTSVTPQDDDYYTFRIDLKRNTEAYSFGGSSSYVINRINANNEKSWWKINTSQSLENRRLTIYPKGGTITGTPNYTSINASMVLSDKSKEALTNVTSLLIFATPQTSVTPKFENKAYAVGDEVENAQNFRITYRVVYSGKPADLDHISFTVTDLEPNEKYYLYAYLCKAEDGNYTYASEALVFSDAIRTTPMETPANVTVGELDGDVIPLTFTATTFKTLVMKSDSVQSCKPQGVLQPGDRDGNVIAILEKGATSCSIAMEPGEMTYLQMFAMTDDETPGYSSNFTLLSLYRQAERLPLQYEFGPKDEITQTEDAMPMLPPGLSTDMTDATNAFFVTFPSHLDHTFYLSSSKAAKDPAWPSVILPAFSGAQNVQAIFLIKFYKPEQLGLTASPPASNDSVRIEYRLNGGEWQTAGLFTKANMPEALGTTYPLSVSFSCAITDIVNVRYSYYTAYSTGSTSMHAIASYEIKGPQACEMPTALQMVNEGRTNTAIPLKWRDYDNEPAAGNYIVSYQKAGADADAWMTQTVNKTETVLNNLEANTAYNVKVQAVCAIGPSPETAPVRMSTAAEMPYIEDMAFVYDDELNDYATTPDLTAYNGELGTELQADDYMGSTTTWSIDYNRAYAFDDALDPDGLGVATDMSQALLATPAIYVRKTGIPVPKTLKFRVNAYDRTTVNDQTVCHDGVDLVDPALRLYVLASTNGTFRWADTVAAFDHNALKAEAAAKDGQRGKELSVELAELGGLVQFAFYFHNPNPFTYDNNTSEDAFPMYLELLGISFRYDGGDNPCFPVENLKTTNVKETQATLSWNGDGEEYGIIYYPANDATQAKTVYQDATETELQTITLEGLMSNTSYMAEVTSYCTKGDRTTGSIKATATFKTQREMFELRVNITPEEAGTVNDERAYTGYYFDGANVTLRASAHPDYQFKAWMDGETELSKDTIYKFKMPNENLSYTAVFEKRIDDSTGQENMEAMVKANFSVSTNHGQLIVRNLNSLLVKDIDVYGLAGNRIQRFTPNSREDLYLPLEAEHALLIVRLNTETGATVYKVYIH